jgi:chemotaxis protein MotB
MKGNTFFILIVLAIFVLPSCVARKKYLDSEIKVRYLKNDSAQLSSKVSTLEENIVQLQSKISALNNQVSDLSKKNAALTSAASSSLSELERSKLSLEQQQAKLEQLQSLLDQQRARAEELKKRMMDALVGFSANDLTITQKNGKVYISLSENLLFPSGSAVVNPQGKEALSKLASVLNVNPDISVEIEGHTDSIPIRVKYQDNWALSTARATSIVRILVNDYKVDPVRVVASGHSMYDPVDTNSTADGRAKNSRTVIILSPKLDELYKLLEQ